MIPSPTISTVPAFSKSPSPSLFWGSKHLLSNEPLHKQKTSHTIPRCNHTGKHSHSNREGNGIGKNTGKQGQNTARQTLCPETPYQASRPHSSKRWVPNGLGTPIPVVAHRVSLCLGPALVTCCSFPQQLFHVPDISNFLRSLLYFWFPSHSFLHGPLRESLPGLPGLPLKSGWKPLWPHSLCILHANKTSTTWMAPKFATNVGSIPVAEPGQGHSDFD